MFQNDPFGLGDPFGLARAQRPYQQQIGNSLAQAQAQAFYQYRQPAPFQPRKPDHLDRLKSVSPAAKAAYRKRRRTPLGQQLAEQGKAIKQDMACRYEQPWRRAALIMQSMARARMREMHEQEQLRKCAEKEAGLRKRSTAALIVSVLRRVFA